MRHSEIGWDESPPFYRTAQKKHHEQVIADPSENSDPDVSKSRRVA